MYRYTEPAWCFSGSRANWFYIFSLHKKIMSKIKEKSLKYQTNDQWEFTDGKFPVVRLLLLITFLSIVRIQKYYFSNYFLSIWVFDVLLTSNGEALKNVRPWKFASLRRLCRYVNVTFKLYLENFKIEYHFHTAHFKLLKLSLKTYKIIVINVLYKAFNFSLFNQNFWLYYCFL